MANAPAAPQQGSTPTKPSQQQQSQSTPQPQQGQPLFRDWAAF